MTTAPACESCGMPIETGRYCSYCTDETGTLQSFDERFERMTAWQARRSPSATRQSPQSGRAPSMASKFQVLRWKPGVLLHDRLCP